MILCFYVFSFFTILFTIFSIIQKSAIYALFYLLASIITTSMIFFLLGSYFIGCLQIIIYAGAILVLFLFIMMMFDSKKIIEKNKIYKIFFFSSIYPITLFSIFILLMIKLLLCFRNQYINSSIIDLKILGINLFGPYIFITEFSSVLLLSALVLVFILSKDRRILKLSISDVEHKDM